MWENSLTKPFNHRGGSVKHVQACWSAREDRESSFHFYGSPVRLDKACLCKERSVHAVLSTEKVLWSTCGPDYVPEKIERTDFTAVKALWGWCNPVYMREGHDNAVFLPRKWCKARTGLLNCQRRSRKHFSPLWWSYKARASLFMWGNYLTNPF